jgi:hypothetical protein
METNRYVKNILIIGELITTLSVLIDIIKIANIGDILKWIWLHDSFALWSLFSLSLIIYFIIDRVKKDKKIKDVNLAYRKWFHFIIIENQLFQINPEKYKQVFTEEELKFLMFENEDIRKIFPYPQDMKERHEKELAEYWKNQIKVK